MEPSVYEQCPERAAPNSPTSVSRPVPLLATAQAKGNDERASSYVRYELSMAGIPTNPALASRRHCLNSKGDTGRWFLPVLRRHDSSRADVSSG